MIFPPEDELKEKYDVLIIGGGPAGLTAAIYASRNMVRTGVVFSKRGGQAADAHIVENYPGFEKIQGSELMERFLAQAKKLGADIVNAHVMKVERKGKTFKVFTDRGETEAKAIIIATGIRRKKLEVPGEELKGVSYCATCDAPLYKGKKVAVVGGGNTALASAELLSEIASKVYLIHRRQEFRADALVVERVRERENVEFVLDSVVEEILGKERVEGVRVRNVKNGEEKVIEVDGVFINVGGQPNSDLAMELGVKTDENGYIIVDERMRTNMDGVFAAGDVVKGPLKQIVTAAAQGAIAAQSAYLYLKGTV